MCDNINNDNKLEKIFNKIKKDNKTKFDSSIDIYINLIFNKKKNKTNNINLIKENLLLPYGNGKKYIILAIIPKNKRKQIKKLNYKHIYIGGNKYINKIKNKKWTKFNVIVTTKHYINKILKLGKILGSKGLIPSNNYITNDPYKEIKNIISSKYIEIKNNNNKIINITIGKTSFENKILIKNLKFILNKIEIIKKKYLFNIKNIYLSSTMGTSFKLNN
ncbi:ribosomal L1 domain-containing protein [Candidatus Shikimatogenerans bostrichidophilus]|uniref:ribosomal L1 domain-containing protein n=1 Tax=Candidatus Shikimatogenerans bostrichidophilus TaxID=2943807 RepID=UPI002966BD20